jgi:hypothetical protein
VLNKQFTNGEWQFVCFPFSLNAADIETIFGKGTEVQTPQPPLGGEMVNGQWSMVNVIEAGLPYRICPTDVLPSPITLEHVQITSDAPQTIAADGYLITGTFQKKDETPAFSAIITDDPNGIEEIKNEKLKMENVEAWYDLGGKPATLPLKGDRKSKTILVTKGRKERR